MRRSVTALVAALTLVLGLAACTPDPEPVAVDSTTIVLDVRTPDEYAEGHLEGARLLDQNAGAVAAAIPTLDPSATYLVYCRSGNRAGQALKLLQDAGFTDVTNLGSLSEASSATGLPVVS